MWRDHPHRWDTVDLISVRADIPTLCHSELPIVASAIYRRNVVLTAMQPHEMDAFFLSPQGCIKWDEKEANTRSHTETLYQT